MATRRVAALVATLVSICAAHAAWAAPRTEAETAEALTRRNYARGSYLFGVVGYYAIENSPVLNPQNYVSSGGFYMRVGARHNRWLATDLTGQYVSNFVFDYGLNRDAYLAWGMTVNERIFLTKSRIQPYVSVGVGFLNIRSSNATIIVPVDFDDPSQGLRGIPTPGSFSPGFTARFGGGLELFWTENVAVNLDVTYNLTAGHISEFDFLTFGLGFTFY